MHSLSACRSRKQLAEALRRAGLKPTMQRLLIAEVLASDLEHPTAQSLFERLHPSLPTLSFATVYNTLGALSKAGLCKVLALDPAAARFDPTLSLHDHAVCERCGSITDVERHSEVPLPKGDSIPGFSVRAVEQVFRGECGACASRHAQQSINVKPSNP